MPPSPRDTVVVVPDAAEAGAMFRGLVDLLWAERELLERVLFRLAAQHAILREGSFTDHPQWIGAADDETRAALAALQDAEILRAAEADAIARRYGVAAGASLLEMARVAPAPWSDILHDHHTAMSELSRDIDDVAARTGELVRECEAVISDRQNAPVDEIKW